MKKVYLDNASTTQIRPEVIQEMTKIMAEDYGNPSSTHSFGRNAKSIVELSRKAIAKNLNCNAQEIVFTSGGTESNNLVLRSCVKDLKIKRIITSKIEHHAVLHTIEALQKEFGIQVDFVSLKALSVDFIVASAHKFHGPKGIGFVFVRKNNGLQPQIFGGEQEKGLRPGTEAVHQIAGMAKAMSLSLDNLEAERNKITDLKHYLIQQLELEFPEFQINGSVDGFYNILNINLPFSEDKTAMILFGLDIKGIAVSRGSACQSGSSKPSHVLAEFLSSEDLKKPSVRISFSHYNEKEDVDLLIKGLKGI